MNFRLLIIILAIVLLFNSLVKAQDLQVTYTKEECNSKCKDECGKTPNCKQSEGRVINGACNCSISTLNIPTYNSLIFVIIGSILVLIAINWDKLSKLGQHSTHLHKATIKDHRKKLLELDKINLRTILILFIIIAGIYYLVSSTALRPNTKSTTFLIEDKCEAEYDYDRTQKIVKQGDGTYNNPEYEERYDVLSNPRLRSESHSITSDSDCRVECGLQCQVISKKYQSHSFNRRAQDPEFIKFDTSYLGAPIYRCYQNECVCSCANI